MEPREPKPQRPKGNPEPPLEVEGGEMDEPPPQQPVPEPPGGMIGEGGGADRGPPDEGGMIGQG